MFFDKNIKIIISIYIIICLIFYLLKPKIMFDNNNKFKNFGIGKDKTIFPLWLCSLIITYIIYYTMLLKCEDYV